MRETLHKSLLRVTAEQTPVILSRAQALFSSALIWSECENITHRFPCRHLGKVNEVAGAVWLTCSVCKVECENAVAHARLANYVHLSRELEWQPKRTGLKLRFEDRRQTRVIAKRRRITLPRSGIRVPSPSGHVSANENKMSDGGRGR